MSGTVAVALRAHDDQVNAIRRDLNASDVWRGQSALWANVDVELQAAVEDVVVFTPLTDVINLPPDLADRLTLPFPVLRWADSPECAEVLYPDDQGSPWARYDYAADDAWLRRHRLTPTRETRCAACSATISPQHRPLGMWTVARSDITIVVLAICLPCRTAKEASEATPT